MNTTSYIGDLALQILEELSDSTEQYREHVYSQRVTQIVLTQEHGKSLMSAIEGFLESSGRPVEGFQASKASISAKFNELLEESKTRAYTQSEINSAIANTFGDSSGNIPGTDVKVSKLLSGSRIASATASQLTSAQQRFEAGVAAVTDTAGKRGRDFESEQDRILASAMSASLARAVARVNKIDESGISQDLKEEASIRGSVQGIRSLVTIEFSLTPRKGRSALGGVKTQVLNEIEKLAAPAIQATIRQAVNSNLDNEIKPRITAKLKELLQSGKDTVSAIRASINERRSKLLASKTKSKVNIVTPNSKGTSAKKLYSSIMTIRDMLDRSLRDTVAKNMGRPNAKKAGTLTYRTGRFASSVRATKVMPTRDGAISVFYTYMKFPYQTFEPGFVQGDKGLDPRRLIKDSIREVLAPLALKRLGVIRE